ncbi:UvrD-helicase domain-containing protein [Haladaptatus sp. GCM10025707]|uniref:UvrD-helicase domain-containing protein n=1 Tax=Haladaptatus sp. GCM10025707 TaxID=3252658 RepID=UPI00360E312E
MVDWDRLTEEQQIAAGTHDRNISLTAGAGTGKTTTLTARYMELLRETVLEDSGGLDDTSQGLSPENILTTTFTERAASELKEKIRTEVSQELQTIDDQESFARWQRIADDIESGYIHTLHGFCSRLLREHALNVPEIAPGFTTLDEDETVALIERTVASSIEALEGTDEIRTLARRFTRSDLKSILSSLLTKRPESLEWAERWRDATREEYTEYVWENLYPISPTFARKTFQGPPSHAFETFERLADESPPISEKDKAWKQLTSILERLQAYGIRDQDVDVDNRARQRCVNEICDILTTSKGERYSDAYYHGIDSNWDGYEAEQQSVAEAMETLWEWLNPPALLVDVNIESDARSFRYLTALAKVLIVVGDRYAAEKRRQNLVDYTDQIEFAYTFLEDHASEETLHELRSQFAFVMVDEFQDTNPRQWDIIKHLTTSNPTSYEGDNVFVVGDSKQSIYRFRNADVTMFGAVQAELQAANEHRGAVTTDAGEGEEFSDALENGEQLSLNFRTLPNVLYFLNALFNRIFVADTAAPFEARPQPLEPARNNPEDIDASVEYLCVPTNEELIENLYEENAPIDATQVSHGAELEAEALAARLTRLFAEETLVYESETVDEEQDGRQAVLNRVRGEGSEANELETRPVEPTDVAVLIRSRTHLKTYERALSVAGIPYTVASGIGFYETPEIEALINLFRTLVSPENERALYATLRSPVFGLPDEKIAALLGDDRSTGSTPSGTHSEEHPTQKSVQS